MPNLKAIVVICLLFFLPAVSGFSDNQFQLIKDQVQITERGKVTSYRLFAGKMEFSFLPPGDWKVQVDSASQSVTFLSQDFVSILAFKIKWGETNQFKIVADKIEVFRNRVRAQHPDAVLKENFECYTNDRKGWAFDFEEPAAKNLSVMTRMAFVEFPGGTLEFILTTPPRQFGALYLFFANFLTSFAIGPS